MSLRLLLLNLCQVNYEKDEHVDKTETDAENRLVVAKKEGSGRGTEYEIGVSRCKLAYIGWVNNK